MIESLEKRRLLSVSLVHGLLRVVGTPGDDVITFRDTTRAPGLLTTGNAPPYSSVHTVVTLNGDNYDFVRDQIRHVVILGGRGNDSIQIAPRFFRYQFDGPRPPAPVPYLYSGPVASVRSASVDSDPFASVGSDLKAHCLIKGGMGDDTIIGSDGPDRIVGGSGNDYIDGLGGHDRLNGGPGDDLFNSPYPYNIANDPHIIPSPGNDGSIIID